MRIFVTGATGFIGQHLTHALVAQQHEVSVLLRTPSKRHLLPQTVQCIAGDMNMFANPKLILPPFDIVIHLAGAIYAPHAEAYYDANCQATINLVQCIQRQSWQLQRFIFASSLAAAGPSKQYPLQETDIPNPIDDYGKAKWAAEQYLQTITTFPCTSFRPAIVLGPSDENTLLLFKMAKYRLGMAINGQAQQLSFVAVADLVNAIILMLADNSLKHETYFVSHPQVSSNKAIFKTMGKLMQHKVYIIPLPKPLLYIAMKITTALSRLLPIKNQLDIKQYQQLTNHFACNSQYLQQKLHWKANYNLHKTLLEAYQWYQTHKKL